MKKYIFSLALMVAASINATAQTEEYKTTLKSMFELSGSEETFKVVIKQVIDMTKQSSPSVPSEVWTEFETEFLKASISDLADMLAPVYVKHLDLSDLKSIIKFYKTPAGKKYAEKTPLISKESMVVGQQWGMGLAQKIQQKMAEKGY